MRFQHLFHPLPQVKNEGGKMASHWCAECDTNTVVSGQKETGLFFAVAGHTLGSACSIEDQYLSVIFAICHDCLEKTSFRNVMAQD